MGSSHPDTNAVIVLLATAFAVSLSTGVAMTLVVSDGHPGLVAQTAAMVVVLNIGATLLAAPLFGLWGVLVATVAAEVTVTIIFLVRFHRRYSIGRAVFVRAVSGPVAISAGVAVPFALWYAVGGAVPSTRGPAIAGTIATGGVYALLCWVLESHWRLLPERLSVNGLKHTVARLYTRRG